MADHGEILDYSKHLVARSSHGRSGGKWFAHEDRFFPSPHRCVFCAGPATQCYGSKNHPVYDPRLLTTVRMDEEAYRCTCGWWSVARTYSHALCGNNFGATDVVLSAILRRFDAAALSLPLDVLRRHLLASPRLLHDLHPRKLEHLVASVFRDFFHCEVEHCGRTGDGGIDLALVLSDRPAIVQVKRRSDPASVECVSAVRELVGAAVIRGFEQVIFVTTANRFSRQSLDAAEAALSRRAVTRFDLIDRHRFLAQLRLVQPPGAIPWWDQLLSRDQERERARKASGVDAVDFICDCGAVIHSDRDYIGHSARCVVCGNVVVLTAERINGRLGSRCA